MAGALCQLCQLSVGMTAVRRRPMHACSPVQAMPLPSSTTAAHPAELPALQIYMGVEYDTSKAYTYSRAAFKQTIARVLARCAKASTIVRGELSVVVGEGGELLLRHRGERLGWRWAGALKSPCPDFCAARAACCCLCCLLLLPAGLTPYSDMTPSGFRKQILVNFPELRPKPKGGNATARWPPASHLSMPHDASAAACQEPLVLSAAAICRSVRHLCSGRPPSRCYIRLPAPSRPRSSSAGPLTAAMLLLIN